MNAMATANPFSLLYSEDSTRTIVHQTNFSCSSEPTENRWQQIEMPVQVCYRPLVVAPQGAIVPYECCHNRAYALFTAHQDIQTVLRSI